MVCREGKGWGSRLLAQGGMNIYGEGAPIITPLAISVHPSLPLLMGVAGTEAPIPHPPSPIPLPRRLPLLFAPCPSALLCWRATIHQVVCFFATGPGRM